MRPVLPVMLSACALYTSVNAFLLLFEGVIRGARLRALTPL